MYIYKEAARVHEHEAMKRWRDDVETSEKGVAIEIIKGIGKRTESFPTVQGYNTQADRVLYYGLMGLKS